MEKQIAVVNEHHYLTAQQIQANARLIQDVMKSVMKKDVHYGTVPGCGDKPTLLKPGAEKILSTFRVAAFPEIQDLSTSDSIRFRIITKGVYTGNGAPVELGAGVGECSSDEEKYKWRKAVGKEYDETPEDRKRKKWKKGGYGKPEYQEVQVRTNPSDLANTILKMAKKRSIVDLTLTVTAASDCFNQDIEDLPAEYVAQDVEMADFEVIDNAQLSQLTDLITTTNSDEVKINGFFKIDNISKLPKSRYKEAFELLKAKLAKMKVA